MASLDELGFGSWADATSPRANESRATAGTIDVYRGPRVGCTWCAYAVGTDATGAPLKATPATHVLHTDRGPRQVCEIHALRGRWDQRKRRVSAVAS